MTTHELAVKQLEALVQIPGTLRVITNEHDHENGIHPTPEDCAAHVETVKGLTEDAEEEEVPIPLTDPRHFVIHDVVSIEGPDEATGLVRARTEEGDVCIGYPADVLARLQQAGSA